MTRLGPLLAATAALAVVLTACDPGDDPDPNYSSVTPTASASTSASPTASSSVDTANVPSGATSPTSPAAAEQNTSDGAFAFVAFYWRQVDWAYSTVNGDALAGLYRTTCKSCGSSRTQIDNVREKNHSLRGGHLTINSQALAPADADPSATFAVDTSLSVEPLTEVDATGAQVATYPASNYTIRAFVAWNGARFEITGTSNLAGG